MERSSLWTLENSRLPPKSIGSPPCSSPLDFVPSGLANVCATSTSKTRLLRHERTVESTDRSIFCYVSEASNQVGEFEPRTEASVWIHPTPHNHPLHVSEGKNGWVKTEDGTQC